jgi:hypothetical protein
MNFNRLDLTQLNNDKLNGGNDDIGKSQKIDDELENASEFCIDTEQKR